MSLMASMTVMVKLVAFPPASRAVLRSFRSGKERTYMSWNYSGVSQMENWTVDVAAVPPASSSRQDSPPPLPVVPFFLEQYVRKRCLLCLSRRARI